MRDIARVTLWCSLYFKISCVTILIIGNQWTNARKYCPDLTIKLALIHTFVNATTQEGTPATIDFQLDSLAQAPSSEEMSNIKLVHMLRLQRN